MPVRRDFKKMSLQQVGATLTNTDFSGSTVLVPDSIKFKTIKSALAARRVPIKIRSEQQSYASNNNRLIKIIMPNNTLYDTRSGFITFNLNVTATGASYVRIADGVFSIFQRMRLMADATEVEDIQDYNRLYSILWELTNPTLVTSNIGKRMGFGTQVQRNAMSTNFDYIMPLYSGVFNTELLPLENIKAALFLELYLEDPTKCIETDGTNPIISITNINFHIERLELDINYTSYIKSEINSKGLDLGFHTWNRFVSTLSTAPRQDIQINHRSSSVNGILNFFVTSADINNPLINDKFLNWPQMGLQQVQIMVNQTLFPDEPIDTFTAEAAEAYQGYCRWIRRWKLNGLLEIAPPISQQVFFVNRFVQIDDFEPYPELDDVINPFTALNNYATMLKRLYFAAPIASGIQLDSWVEYFQRMIIQANGKVTVAR